MEISVQNFGPIYSAEVVVKPLTVFIGPNNSGKSYFAMLTYASALVAPPFRPYFSAPSIQSPAAAHFLSTALTRINESDLDPLIAQYRSDPQLIDLSPSVIDGVNRLASTVLREYARAVGKELERCFGSRLSELQHRNGSLDVSFIEISNPRPAWTVRIEFARGKRTHSLTRPPDPKAIIRAVFQRLRSQTMNWPDSLRLPADRIDARSAILDQCFAGFPSDRYYLPAARSGMLHSHRLFASMIVGRAPLAGIEAMAIPKMTGVISDFIAHLLQLEPRERGKLEPVARFLEGGILRGDVEIRGRPQTYPEITYRVGTGRFPLHRTSSMISELAPIVLFLRYLVNPDELLIIEEPESHLHPESQLRFARAIAQLVNRDVTTLLTTHSDFFLTEINNTIRAAALLKGGVSLSEFDLTDAIPPRSVGAYLFAPGDDLGTVVRRIPVSPQNGISDAEFSSVNQVLYDKTVRLQRRRRIAESKTNA
jgi:predicted ATPase